MSYQVLARKWRPRVFKEMVGQEHVLKALINALDTNRLHHAYLFTGTRGVGKTSIARILAKCLNCEAGVSSEPCDQCNACEEINGGRFVDLIEVDAASRTKVEDTRELLDNVQYAPTKGRYKVYLIDEVHMLSGHSFNALLKTLEEPPPHVKFLLATTDPQKLPVTILSRCLQFSLKNMSPERIVEHLEHILGQESIPFEASALWQLGRSADGSMRDALSLTDQAISFGDGKISEADVSSMLGAIDQRKVYEILYALAENDGSKILQCVDQMAEQSPDYADALANLINVLHRLAVAQVLPEAIDNTFGDRDDVLKLAQQFPGEDVQLFYQTALLGRRDLPLAPDPRGGFEMVLLRMLAFKPQGIQKQISKPSGSEAKENESGSLSQQEVDKAEGKKPESNPLQEAPLRPEIMAENQKQQDAEALVNDTPVITLDNQSESRQATQKPEESTDQDATKLEFANNPIEDPETRRELSASIDQDLESYQALQADHSEAENQQEDRTPREVSQSAPQAESIATQDQDVFHETETREEHSTNNFSQHDVAELSEVLGESEKAAEQGAEKMASVEEQRISLSELKPQLWNTVVSQLPIGGVIHNTVMNCQLIRCEGSGLEFILDEQNSTLYDDSHQQRLQDILTDYFSEAVYVNIVMGAVTEETPQVTKARLKAERLALALRSMKSDPKVQEVIKVFSAKLIEETVKPIDLQ